MENRIVLIEIFKYADLNTAVALGAINKTLRTIYHDLSFELLWPHFQIQTQPQTRTQTQKQRNTTWKKILRAYICYFKYLPKQGTEQWLKLRIHTVGGSEIATVIGENPYQGVKDFVGGKLGIKAYRFEGNEATRWGKMFEPVFRFFVESLFSNKIYETGSIPGYRDNRNIVIQSYSPDGLGITSVARIGKMIDITSEKYVGVKASEDPKFHNIKTEATRNYQQSKNPDDRRFITLFEFKCPLYGRIDGSVPGNYISQPMAGLCTIPIAKMALFMQGIYRRCTAEMFQLNNEYDNKEFHYNPKFKPKVFETPLLMGFNAFYTTNPNTPLPFDTSRNPQSKKQMTTVESEVDQAVLVELFMAEVGRRHSDYFEMEMCIANVVKIAKLLMKCAPETKPSTLWDIFVGLLPSDKQSAALKSKVVRQSFMETMPPTPINYLEKINNIPLRDISTTSAKEFNDFMEIAIDGSGIEIYYPQGAYHVESLDPYFDQDVPANYMDDARDPQRYLYNNLMDFMDFCCTNNYTPIGFMPWKMFEYSCIPVYKDINYIKNILPKLEHAHKMISDIRSTTDYNNFESELDRRIPTKKDPKGSNSHSSDKLPAKAPSCSGSGRGTPTKKYEKSPTRQAVDYGDMDDFFNDIH
jgi:hypothetical protein